MASGAGAGLQKGVLLAALFGLLSSGAYGHIIPPEKLHPVAEAYRRATFVLNLNPVAWDQVRPDLATIADHWKAFDADASAQFRNEVAQVIERATAGDEEERLGRREAAARVFEHLTKATSAIVGHHLEAVATKLEDHPAALQEIREAHGTWAAFEDVVRSTDPQAHQKLGEAWLGMASAIGTPGLLGQGVVAANLDRLKKHSQEISDYLDQQFGAQYTAASERRLAPWPMNSPTFDAQAQLPVKLPPGHNINKQIPRPRQILGMAARGVDEGETALIALGDMAFDSTYIFGEPARSLALSCNTCHNKSITNPQFTIPGLSARAGGLDVSNGFFAPHANNGLFDPLDIPDLRGIRFTAPYGRNGRFASLREFTRNVIVNEFNGPEPDPTLLDGMIAYMLEFEFLSNPKLNGDGSLNDQASESERRGEEIFRRPFDQMGGRSCASCHVPSTHFLDRQSHDIGTVAGLEPGSRDRAMDTPTLLCSQYNAPYFHDGSQPTLRAVNEWFNEKFDLGLSGQELDDLTAYVEAVGDGTGAYEDTVYYLDAELEEFSFFLSAFEFLSEKKKPELINTTFQTIALELRNHKWELQDLSYAPIMDRLAEIMDEAYEANLSGDRDQVVAKVKEYRALYEENAEVLK